MKKGKYKKDKHIQVFYYLSDYILLIQSWKIFVALKRH